MTNYTDKIDKAFGSNFKHRSLRTIFDNMSSEWNDTDLDEKLKILTKIIDSNISLPDLIFRYKFYYQVEMSNKKHVLSSLDESLAILLEETIKQNNK